MKRIISVFLASLMLVLAATPLAAQAVCITDGAGDANGDGLVSLSDVTLMLKKIAGHDVTIDGDRADVNRDGKLTLSDVTLMLKYIANYAVFPGHGDAKVTESCEVLGGEGWSYAACSACGHDFGKQTFPSSFREYPYENAAIINVNGFEGERYVSALGAFSSGDFSVKDGRLVMNQIKNAAGNGVELAIPLTSTVIEAASVDVDLTENDTDEWLRVGLSGENGTAWLRDGAAVYIVDGNGAKMRYVTNRGDSAVRLPAGFGGTLVLPFEAFDGITGENIAGLSVVFGSVTQSDVKHIYLDNVRLYTNEKVTDGTAEYTVVYREEAAAKTQNVFDITDFGAVSDGVTDCTEAIQAAIEAARKVWGKVLVPPGNYLTGYLKVGNGVTIEGTAGWSFGAYGLSTFTLNDPKAKCVLDVTDAWQCTIKGISLVGKYLGKNVHGIYSYNRGTSFGGNPIIDDCRIEHFTGDGIHFEHQGCFKVLHSMMFENRGAGLYLYGCDGFILDNWLTGNLNCGMYGSNASALTLTANRVEWNGVAGIKLDCGDTAEITGNSFDRNSGPGLWLGSEEWLYDGVSVTGNNFRRNGNKATSACASPYERSHLYMENVTNAAVTGNTFMLGRDDGDGGVYSPDFSIFLDDCDAVTVTGNSMKNGALKESIIWDELGECVFIGNTGVTAIRRQTIEDWEGIE